MAISAALLRQDEAEYRAFRDEVMARYTPAEGQQKAEHLLKVCLIHPAAPQKVAQLRKDVDTMGDPRRTPCPAWSAFSLSLYCLRDGNYDGALDACEMGLASPECKDSCKASLEAVAAMAHASMGKADLAGAALRKARDIARTCDGKDFAQGKPVRPYWFDWAIAELLIKEAGEHVETASR
jgi:eukaryotic-like serine/threonine-protein kinase